MKCPLCGGQTFPHPANADLLVCDRCAETLTPAETVKRATGRTRRRYLKANPEAQA